MSFLGATTFSTMKDDDIDPDIKYWNATITNSSTDLGGHVDPQVYFNESRDTPIVRDASKYAFSIVRFSMDGIGRDLPLFIPLIRQGALNPTNNVNLTIYSLTIENAVNYTVGPVTVNQTFTSLQPILYSPETLDTSQAPVPDPSTCQTGQNIDTRYYWVYTYSHWLSLVNNAFQAAMTDIQSQFATAWAAAGGVGPAPTLQTAPPTMAYDPSTGLFSLYADRYGFGGADRTAVAGADENCKLYFNANMFGLFANFRNLYVNLPNERTNEIFIGNILYQNILSVSSPPAPAAKSYWSMVQEMKSTDQLWSPVSSIVFCSSLLPLVNEETGDPIRIGAGNLGTFNGSQSAFEPIITDITLDQSEEGAYSYKGSLLYVPQGEYRMTSFLRSKNAINNIDIRVYWRCRYDNKIRPVTMFNSSTVSIKCMFRRRGHGNVPHPTQYGYDV